MSVARSSLLVALAAAFGVILYIQGVSDGRRQSFALSATAQLRVSPVPFETGDTITLGTTDAPTDFVASFCVASDRNPLDDFASCLHLRADDTAVIDREGQDRRTVAFDRVPAGERAWWYRRWLAAKCERDPFYLPGLVPAQWQLSSCGRLGT